ncbi:hypothetical protein [Schleiferilactobacillus harbinensis]|uniref:hypothetical protein n=1 Tax=Schleiferilactobacillus harbinensis TaxID=304207 RepID=UPI001D0308FA|nr:hypothetical protein [Schleiferilactobacillus harbinensis]
MTQTITIKPTITVEVPADHARAGQAIPRLGGLAGGPRVSTAAIPENFAGGADRHVPT